jgi:hypothetical protein
MSITHTFQCDGCDKVDVSCRDSLPSGWNWAAIYLNWWERPRMLLCYSCSIEVRRFGFLKATLIKLGWLK